MDQFSGFLFIDKEEGITSQGVDTAIKKKFHIKKVGHFGTLDPFATGLLIIGMKEGTKFFPLIQDERKTYRATLSLGKETDTLDWTGSITKEKEVPNFSEDQIKSVLSSFLGKQKQEVPLYSAKHINGERGYELLRKGIEFVPPTVDIEVKNIELLSYSNDEIQFDVSVSKGTYIRSLGRDIAYRLNTVGHLTALRRTQVDDYKVINAKKINDITEDDIVSIPAMFPNIPLIEVSDIIAKRAIAGNDIRMNRDEDLLFLQQKGVLIALYRKDEEGHYVCQRGVSHD